LVGSNAIGRRQSRTVNSGRDSGNGLNLDRKTGDLSRDGVHSLRENQKRITGCTLLKAGQAA